MAWQGAVNSPCCPWGQNRQWPVATDRGDRVARLPHGRAAAATPMHGVVTAHLSTGAPRVYSDAAGVPRIFSDNAES